MIQNKFVFILLAVLLLIKFAYLPWSEWADQKQDSTGQLSAFNNKQQNAIGNEALLTQQLEELEQSLDAFTSELPSLGKDEKTNALWFKLIESLKKDSIRVYNQKVDFEELITSKLGFITGSVSISGPAEEVIQAVLSLEAKAPSVFLDKLHLNQSGKSSKDIFVAQLYVGYWFSRKEAANYD